MRFLFPWPHIAWLVVLILLAALLLGYHPFAEDGGIYSAAVDARMSPALFPHDRIWVTAHTRFALFVPFAAVASRLLHLAPHTILLTLHVAGLFALLAAAAHLARTCLRDEHRPWLATLLVAIGAGLPIAGTALYAVDPYCTARTLTTPLLLAALSFALRERWPACAFCWAIAATMHPLMAIWGALPLLLAASRATRHPRRWISLLIAVVFAASILLSTAFPHESIATRAVAHTRAYWFPAQWRWYEWVGAAAPCALLFGVERYKQARRRKALHRLGSVILATTVIATALALCCARESAATLTVARLQPLRSLHLVFLAFLVGGGALLQTLLRTTRQRIAAVLACGIFAMSVLAMQRSLYPNTPHLEWPGSEPRNGWEAAFAWCRQNTPANALFALDANYIAEPIEDSHGFRAIALRSVLPDGIKDAGVAAVLPDLTASWQTGVTATRNLNQVSDAERIARLTPLGVTWIVLPAPSATGFPCPFQNKAAKVCQVPAR